jgi:glyoxylase-like metal-dependent hydrolase (beta-lactamase superfamily II)
MVGRIRTLVATLAAALTSSAASAAEGPPLSLWRLDCGRVGVPDIGFLSDTFAFSGPKEVAVSCYLIRHGDRYLLWDAGLPLSRLSGERTPAGGLVRQGRSIADQLKELGLTPDAVGIVALSHYHSDHAGQAAGFPKATLMIGAEDMAVVRSDRKAFNLEREPFAPWTRDAGKVDLVEGDRDVFGDGRVVMLATPGHTPGHHSLLVRLSSGPLILTGDLWHFAEQKPINGVPTINTSRAETLASMDRIGKAAANLGAAVVIGHEPDDIAKLPAFPAPAR